MKRPCLAVPLLIAAGLATVVACPRAEPRTPLAARAPTTGAPLETASSGGDTWLSRTLPGFRLGRYDLAFAAASLAVVGVTLNHDRDITRQVLASDSRLARRVAGWVEPLGEPLTLAPALAVAWGAGRLAHAPGLEAAVTRAGVSIGVAGAGALALKRAFGRSRPRESPLDARRFQPFSSHASLPSGHATLAFAAATALDRETASCWVPAIAYPVAAMVGWSRVHDREHWTSDVLSGAALGFWAAGKSEDVLRARTRAGAASRLLLLPGAGGVRAVYSVRF